MEGNFDLSRMPLDGVLKMIVAEVVKESNRQNVEYLDNKLDEIKQLLLEVSERLDAAEAQRESLGASEEVIFGHYHRNDLIRKCDKNLYEGDHAPFRSKDCLQRFRSKHPLLFFKGGDGLLVARAGDIYDLLYNQEDRDIANGKGIRFNKKRK